VRRSFIAILEGRDRRGWGDCVAQMRKVVKFLELILMLGTWKRRLMVVLAVGDEGSPVVCGGSSREGA